MKLQLQKPKWTEKRDSLRIAIECPITFTCVRRIGGIFGIKSPRMNGLMIKPSMMGLRIISQTPIPKGTRVKIEVKMKKLGYHKSYDLIGNVMWSDYSQKTQAYEQGVRLHHISPDINAWHKFISSQLKTADVL